MVFQSQLLKVATIGVGFLQAGCLCCPTRTVSDAVAAAGMDNNSLDELQIGDSRSGVLGPLTLAAGLPADEYNVYIYVRVFDTFQSFTVYSVAPVQVTICCCY